MKNSLMISCEEATQLVVMKKGQKLGFYDKMRLSFHLMMCKYCSRFEEQNRIIDRNIKKIETAAGKEMPPDARSKIEKEIINDIN